MGREASEHHAGAEDAGVEGDGFSMKAWRTNEPVRGNGRRSCKFSVAFRRKLAAAHQYGHVEMSAPALAQRLVEVTLPAVASTTGPTGYLSPLVTPKRQRPVKSFADAMAVCSPTVWVHVDVGVTVSVDGQGRSANAPFTERGDVIALWL